VLLDGEFSSEKTIYAGYAEVTKDITDRLVVSAGGRYTYEQQRASNNAYGALPAEQATPFSPTSFAKFTPRVTARFAVTPQSNIYASYSKGFKSGSVTANDFTTPPVKPEDITAYEIGFKGRPLPGLTFNIAAYYYDYKNLQVARFTGTQIILQNAASARIKGIDADVTWVATPRLTLSAGGSLLDAKYQSFPDASVSLPTGFGGNFDSSIDASGLRMIRAPKFTGNVSADYRLETGSGEFGAFASLYYNAGFKWDVNGRIREGAYANVDAELSFKPAAINGLRLVLWGRNLTDRDIKQSVLSTAFADGVSYAAPRTFGARAEFTF
jgi:iron complex outermembrane receptor protein